MTGRAVTKNHEEREYIIKRKNKIKQKTKKLSSSGEITDRKQTQTRVRQLYRAANVNPHK